MTKNPKGTKFIHHWHSASGSAISGVRPHGKCSDAEAKRRQTGPAQLLAIALIKFTNLSTPGGPLERSASAIVFWAQRFPCCRRFGMDGNQWLMRWNMASRGRQAALSSMARPPIIVRRSYSSYINTFYKTKRREREREIGPRCRGKEIFSL